MRRIVWMAVTHEPLAAGLCETLNKHDNAKARYHTELIHTASGPLLTLKHYVVTVNAIPPLVFQS